MKTDGCVALHSLRSDALCCALSPMGAALAGLTCLGRDGGSRQVLLAPLAHRLGETDPSLAGRTVAPCCGRVRGAKIAIDGVQYRLDANEGENHLHGGINGAAGRRWETLEADGAHIAFAIDLPDGEGGYPGRRRLRAEYRLEGDALTVNYCAETDRPGWLCATNHAYWDLSGRFDGSAMRQRLEIPAARAVRNDGQHLPVAIASVAGTPFDFRTPATPAGQMEKYLGDDQLAIARGFNNALLLEDGAPFAARLTDPAGTLRMTMTTDYPALVFYSGGFLGADTPLEGGTAATPGCALALEAQTLPDPFHLPGAVPEPLLPGRPWRHFIRWQFEWL